MSYENPEPKQWGVTAIGMLLGFLLMGCLPSATDLPSTRTLPPPLAQASPHQSNSGQSLPISAQAQVLGQVIDLEVAQTPQQQAMGLMYRTALADNRGMLFPFNPPQPVSFWMKNVPVPLDMIFLRDGKVVEVAANVPPCTTASCPVYGPKTPINQVIELRAGRVAELGLRIGDSVSIRFLSGSKT
jgi:uncharacterized membrane protein (UPF0127 family)